MEIDPSSATGMLEWAHSEDRDVKKILDATEKFIEALKTNDSALTPGTEIWTLENAKELYVSFIENSDEGKRPFQEKLSDQFQSTSKEAIQLFAELHCLMLLPLIPGQYTAGTKIREIKADLEIGKIEAPLPSWLVDAFSTGALHGGQAFTVGKFAQMRYLIVAARNLLKLDREERTSLLNDPIALRDFLDDESEFNGPTQRRTLLYLLRPGFFPPIANSDHRKLILKAFASELTEPSGDEDIDFYAIHRKLVERSGEPVDFYADPYLGQWEEKSTSAGMKEQEQRFKNWLQQGAPGLALKKDTANRYARVLKSAIKPLNLDGITTNLFAYESLEEFQTVKEIVTNAPGFLEINQKKSGRGDLNAALNNYAQFLSQKPNEPYTTRGDVVQVPPQAALEPFAELNSILYGPPGTGKTYSTVLYAVAMIEDANPVELEATVDRKELLQRYQGYKRTGQIGFVTFHQSYGYEDFIEGIRPVLSDEDSGAAELGYTLHSGVFKDFCKQVAPPKTSSGSDLGIRKNPTVWKVTLGGAGPNPVRTDCFENNRIRVAYDEYGPYDGDTDFRNLDKGGTVLNSFWETMQIGDLVVSFFGNGKTDAIGVITGEPEWLESVNDYKSSRTVSWLIQGIDESVNDLNGGIRVNLATVHRLVRVDANEVLRLVERLNPSVYVAETNEKRVFIIDEINRGNISRIFGELITLIEPDKRLGAAEERTATLPYSREEFGVPDNVYILGTMNTADRSIALLDTALRRRFSFIELQPDPSVLEGINVGDIKLSELLTVLNERISALLDRDHTIGHSYFVGLQLNPTIEALGLVFKNKVVPLLQEYFYDDYEKIQVILGDNQKTDESTKFFQTPEPRKNLLGDYEYDPLPQFVLNTNAFDLPEAYEFFK